RRDIDASVTDQTEALMRAAETVLETTDSVTASLKIQASDTVSASERAASEIREIGGLFQSYTDQLDHAASEAQKRSISARDTLDGSIQALTDASDNARDSASAIA
ncbi:MAG TPA: hypothetical protein DCG04_08690, partial [Rhodospirillaceae bacterium]|nr:hypothetical protein [Rhodospirillaceae bacterium]